MISLEQKAEELKKKIRDIPDFPVPGILFRDITPLLQDPAALKTTLDLFIARYRGKGIEQVVAVESRGYILGGAIAYGIGAGFVLIRKPGKLPSEKISKSYTLEYGANVLEVHRDAIRTGQRVLIVDDLIATGGSALATKHLVEKLGGKVVEFAFLIELTDLKGRDALEGAPVFSLIQY